MVGVPLLSIAQISSKRLKPPQKTVGFFWDWKQITQQTNKQKRIHNQYIYIHCEAAIMIGWYIYNCEIRRFSNQNDVLSQNPMRKLAKFSVHIFFQEGISNTSRPIDDSSVLSRVYHPTRCAPRTWRHTSSSWCQKRKRMANREVAGDNIIHLEA